MHYHSNVTFAYNTNSLQIYAYVNTNPYACIHPYADINTEC